MQLLEKLWKHRNTKRGTTERRRHYSVSEPNYHTTKFFTEHLLATEMRKTQISMSKSDWLGLSILDLSKIAMYEFCYDCVKRKYDKNAKLCHMDRNIQTVSLFIKIRQYL